MVRVLQQNLNFRKDVFDVEGLSNALEKGYLDHNKDRDFVQKKSFSPSSLGYQHSTCARYWYQLFEGVAWDEKMDAISVPTMWNGTDAHTRIQTILEEMEILVSKEVEINFADPPIRGFIDVLVRWDSEVVVGEIKTTSQEAFLVKQNLMKAAPAHLLQLLIYMKATGKKKGFVIYENRNSLQYIIIPVEMDEKNDKIVNDVFKWLRLVWKSWEDKEIPQRPFRKSSKICKHCPIMAACWDREDEGFDLIPAMEIDVK